MKNILFNFLKYRQQSIFVPNLIAFTLKYILELTTFYFLE